MSDAPWKLRTVAHDLDTAGWPGFAIVLREVAERVERDEADALRLRVAAEAAEVAQTRACSSCAFFDAPASYTAPFGACRLTPATATKGDDEAAIEASTGDWPDWDDGAWMLAAHPGVTAYTSDASGYRSTLHVHPDHSCSLWEDGGAPDPKDSPDASA